MFLGDAETDATAAVAVDPTNDPALNAIRAISVPMGQLRQRINAELNDVANADSTVDIGQLGADLQQMTVYTQQLQSAILAFQSSPAYQADAQTARLLSNWLAFAEAWLSQVGAAIEALPNDVADYLAGILSHAGAAATSAALPWIAAGVGLFALALYGVKSAEKTRTYRRYVA